MSDSSKKKKVVTINKINTNSQHRNTQESGSALTHPYLKEILDVNEIEKTFLCNLCTSNQPRVKGKPLTPIGGHTYWLKRHLETAKHRGFTKEEDNVLLEQAIESLNPSKKNRVDNVHEDDEQPSYSDARVSTAVEKKGKKILVLSKKEEAKFYLDLAQFIVTNHLPFDSASPLLKFCQHIVSTYDEQLIERSHTSPTTMSRIIRDCMGETLKSKVLKDLEDHPFALLMDASTDIYGGKYFAVLARYIDNDQEMITTKLLAVLELKTASTGEEFYNLVEENIFSKNPAIRKNFIALCTDNGSSMISSHGHEVDPNGKGIVNRFIKDNDKLIFVRDMCHVF